MFVHSLNKVSGENKVAGAFSAKVGTFIIKLILGDKQYSSTPTVPPPLLFAFFFFFYGSSILWHSLVC